ncbi:hypothetical protein BHE74_00032083 [Ensete ventricosum]|nr:hypothetical protein BHE74_00032083 [Ensete ventricosum]
MDKRGVAITLVFLFFFLLASGNNPPPLLFNIESSCTRSEIRVPHPNHERSIIYLFSLILPWSSSSEALTKVDDASSCMPNKRSIWQICVKKVCNDECTNLGFEGGKCFYKIRCDCYTNCD